MEDNNIPPPPSGKIVMPKNIPPPPSGDLVMPETDSQKKSPIATTTPSESLSQDGAKVLSDVSEQFRKAGTQGEKPLSESGTSPKKLVEDTPTYEDKQSLSTTDIANEKKRLEKMPTSESMLLESGSINDISSDIVRNKNISEIASQDPNVLKLNSLILERDKAIQANEGQKVADLSSEIESLKKAPADNPIDLQQQLQQHNLQYQGAPQDTPQEVSGFKPQTLNDRLVANKAKPVKTVGELHDLSNEAQKKVSELEPELDKIKIPFDEQVAQLRKENRFKSTEENGVRKLEGIADAPEAFVMGARNTFKDGLGMLKQVFGTKEDRQNYSDQRALEDGVLFPTETKGGWTSGAEMAGGVAPYIATGALGGETILGQILSNGLTMGATGIGSAYHQEYQKQKALGLSKDDADKVALEKSAFHGGTQAVLGGSLPFLGGASKSILMHPKDLKLLEQFAEESALGKPYAYNAKNIKASLKGFASEMGGIQTAFAGEHIANNAFDKYVLGDKKKNLLEGTADVIMQGSLLHLGMHVLPSVPKAIKDIYDVNFSKRYPSIQQAVDMAMQEGKITKEQADAITVPLRQKYAIYNAMPEGLTAEQMVSIKPETEQILELSKKEPSAVENPDITKDRIAQLQKTIAEKLGTPLTEKEQKSYEKLQEKKSVEDDVDLNYFLENTKKNLEEDIVEEIEFAKSRKPRNTLEKVVDKITSNISFDPYKWVKSNQRKLDLFNENPLAYYKKYLEDRLRFDEKYPAKKDEQYNQYIQETIDKLKNKKETITPSEKSELKHYENRIATAENEKAKQAEEKKAEKETATETIEEKGVEEPKEEVKAEVETPTETIQEKGVEEGKSDADIEKRMLEIQDKKVSFDSPEQKEFNALEKEMEKRERATVFNVPLEKVNDAVDALMKKEKEQPNGYGSFIEKRDARETKEVADKYLNAKELTDAELRKDFKDAVVGNPDTWYADGLKLRESMKEASNRGIDTQNLVAEVEKEFIKDGYTSKDAKETVARKLSPIFKGSQKVNEKQIAEQSLKETPKAETPTTTKESNVVEGSGGVGGEKTYADFISNGRLNEISDKFKSKTFDELKTLLADQKDKFDRKVKMGQKDQQLRQVVWDLQELVSAHEKANGHNSNLSQKDTKFATENTPKDDGFDYVRNKFSQEGVGGKRLSDKESNILNKEVDKLIDRAEKENGVKRNELKQATWKTNDGYTVTDFFENGRGGTRIITPKGEEINLFDNKYKGESGRDISYFSKAHEPFKATEQSLKETPKAGSVVGGEVEVPKTLSELKLSDETTQTLENKLKELELERTNKLIENKGRGRFDDRLKDEIDEVKRKIYQRENELASRRNSDLESKIKDGSLLKLIAKNKITAEDARGLIIESGMEVPSEIQSIVDKNKQDKKENKQSIIERDTDFLGNEKEAYMVNNDKANGIRTQEDIEYFKSNVKRAIDNGKYQKAIADGKMTANDAKIIIESYGLKVPKDILEQSLKETPQSETKVAEKGVEEPITEEIKTAIDNGEITREQVDGFIEQDESVITDIERKAESENEAELNEAIDQTDKLIGEAVGATEGEKQPTDKGTSEDKVTGIKKAMVEKDRADAGLPPIELPKSNKPQEQLERAKELVDSGEVDPSELEAYLISHAENPSDAKTSEADQYILQYQRMKIEARSKEILTERMAIEDRLKEDPTDVQANLDLASNEIARQQNIYDLDRNTTASRVTSSIWGKLGNAKQQVINERGIVQEQINRIKELHGKDVPKEVQDKLDSLEKKNTELTARIEAIEKNITEQIAQGQLNKESRKPLIRRTSRRSDEEINAQIKDKLSTIANKIAERIEKSSVKNFAANKESTKSLIADIAPDVMDVVKLVSEKTGNKLEDVVNKTYDTIKDIAEGIGKRDIVDIIAGKYSDKKPLSELQKQINEIRNQAKLTIRLEEIENKIERETKARGEASPEVKALRKEISELQSQEGLRKRIEDVKNGVEKKVKEKGEQSEEVKALRKELSDLESQDRLKKRIEDLQNGVLRETKARGEASPEVQKLKKQADELNKKNKKELANFSANELKKQAEHLQKKIDKGEFLPQKTVKKAFEQDANWVKYSQEKKKLKQELNHLEAQALYDKKNLYMKTLDQFNKFSRLGLFIFSTAYQLKLAAAALSTIAHKPIEDLVGTAIKPMVKEIANRAPIEGRNINAEATTEFYKNLSPIKILRGAYQILSKGESDLSRELSSHPKKEGNILNPLSDHSVLNWIADDPHKIIKNPIKQGIFDASLANYMNYYASKGMDINDPILIEKARQASYMRAEYEIFMGGENSKTAVSEWFKKMESEGILDAQSESFKTKVGGNLKYSISALKNFIVPIASVPANILNRTVKNNPISTAYRFSEALKTNSELKNNVTETLDNLTEAQADLMLRDLKKGAIGSVYWTLGFIMAGNALGGFFNKSYPDKKRDKDEKEHDEMEIFGKNIPHGVQHAVPLQQMQMAATFALTLKYFNEQDKKTLKDDFGLQDEIKNVGAGVAEVARTYINEHPMSKASLDIVKALEGGKGREKYFNSLERRSDIPQTKFLLQDIGLIDKDDSYKKQKYKSNNHKEVKDLYDVFWYMMDDKKFEKENQ